MTGARKVFGVNMATPTSWACSLSIIDFGRWSLATNKVKNPNPFFSSPSVGCLLKKARCATLMLGFGFPSKE